jgi:hypothetical protein
MANKGVIVIIVFAIVVDIIVGFLTSRLKKMWASFSTKDFPENRQNLRCCENNNH